MPTLNGIPCLNGSPPKVQSLQKAVKRAQTIRELRELQEDVLRLALDKTDDAMRLCALARAYCELRDRIRIEKGLIKPGSRNVSVREEPKEPVRRGRGRGSHNASATLASAAAALGISPTGQVTGPPAIEVESVRVVNEPNKSQ